MTYSSSLAVGRQRFATRHQNAVNFKEQARTLGPVSNTIILVVLSCLLGLLYLTQVTKTNATGYKIDGLQKQYSELQKEHDDLELSAARLQSLDRVASSPASQNLVSVAPTATLR
jgi:cell division protein FtsL